MNNIPLKSINIKDKNVIINNRTITIMEQKKCQKNFSRKMQR